MARVHESKIGTYHPDPSEEIAWTINDTRGYMDGGAACDSCGACDCEDCPHFTRKDNTPCRACECARCRPEEDYGPEDPCVGLSFFFHLLDGGDVLCEDCAKKEGIEIVPCDCG